MWTQRYNCKYGLVVWKKNVQRLRKWGREDLWKESCSFMHWCFRITGLERRKCVLCVATIAIEAQYTLFAVCWLRRMYAYRYLDWRASRRCGRHRGSKIPREMFDVVIRREIGQALLYHRNWNPEGGLDVVPKNVRDGERVGKAADGSDAMNGILRSCAS